MSESCARPSGSAGRRSAEWVTLIVSTLLVLSTAGFLIYQALRGNEDVVPVRTRLLFDQTQQTDGRYVLPLELRNDGRVTVKDLKVLVTFRSADGSPETTDVGLDYLPAKTTQTVYLYFDRNPSELDVQARPTQYQLD